MIGLATSKDLNKWERHDNNPVLRVCARHDNKICDGFDTQFASDAKVFWDNGGTKDDGNAVENDDDDDAHWVMFYFGVGKGGAHIMIAHSKDLVHWVPDPVPLYAAGGNPSGLDKQYAHKISLVRNPCNETFYMFYCAVGDAGRGIGLITSKPV